MIHHGDCLDVMAAMEPESVDAICTDPPYGLGFMGKAWDDAARLASVPPSAVKLAESGRDPYPKTGKGPSAVAFDGRAFQSWCEEWGRAAYRVAKPSAYLLAFGGTRTVHRMTVALEDAGWIIRDMLVWAYASGFPKSKASLKPAWEPVVMARKPGPLRELAIDACRIGTEPMPHVPGELGANGIYGRMTREGEPSAERRYGENGVGFQPTPGRRGGDPFGRWPANVILGDALFEPGVDGVVVGGSLTGTMTAWSSSPDSEQSPIVLPASNAAPRSSRGVPGVSFPGSATEPAGTQLDAWGTSTDTSRTDTGCSDGTTADTDATSGSTARSGRTRTARSLPATSSTTGTATDSTTDSTTSSASAEPSTPRITSPSEPGPTEWPDSASLSDDAANWRRNSPRAGEPSAERRYTDRGGTDFAPLPGERRDVDGYGYSRFFLIPKADRADREPVLGGLPLRDAGEATGMVALPDPRMDRPQERRARANVHPTVKPTELMRHLVRLVTPPGGLVLDPFLGSGTTGLACELEGFPWVGIEREEEYVKIAEARLNGTQRGLGLVG